MNYKAYKFHIIIFSKLHKWLAQVSEHIKFAYLNNQSCQPRPTFTDLNSDEIHCYSFVVDINKCGESWDTTDDSFGKICVSYKWKRKPKSISGECKCKFDSRECK